ncbi:MAG TPA: lamin tail domain-containing protein, partial [Steroidobacteraceae bacterium]
MINKTLVHAMLGAGALLAVSGTALADTVSTAEDIRITEFMYKGEGSPGEFVEFTNMGTTAVDMTGWSEDDSTRVPDKSGHS